MHERDLEPILTEVVDAAIAITGADSGNIRLIEHCYPTQDRSPAPVPGLVAELLELRQQGKGDMRNSTRTGRAGDCRGHRTKPDLYRHPGAGHPSWRRVRAVQSTPLMSREGKSLGMFSTHFKAPHRPDDRQPPAAGPARPAGGRYH